MDKIIRAKKVKAINCSIKKLFVLVEKNESKKVFSELIELVGKERKFKVKDYQRMTVWFDKVSPDTISKFKTKLRQERAEKNRKRISVKEDTYKTLKSLMKKHNHKSVDDILVSLTLFLAGYEIEHGEIRFLPPEFYSNIPKEEPIFPL